MPCVRSCEEFDINLLEIVNTCFGVDDDVSPSPGLAPRVAEERQGWRPLVGLGEMISSTVGSFLAFTFDF